MSVKALARAMRSTILLGMACILLLPLASAGVAQDATSSAVASACTNDVACEQLSGDIGAATLRPCAPTAPFASDGILQYDAWVLVNGGNPGIPNERPVTTPGVDPLTGGAICSPIGARAIDAGSAVDDATGI